MKASLIIMAAGQSKRMGQNKLFLTYEGQTFIERALDLAISLDVEERLLVISSEDCQQINVPETVKVVINDYAEKGQSYSVRLGTQAASGLGYVYLPIDQPRLTRKLMRQLLLEARQDNLVIPEYEGILCSPAYFGNRFRDELLRVEGEAGGRSVRDAHREAWQLVAVENHEILEDIDTPDAYQALLNEGQLVKS